MVVFGCFLRNLAIRKESVISAINSLDTNEDGFISVKEMLRIVKLLATHLRFK